MCYKSGVRILLSLFALAACGNGIPGSGTAKTEVRDVAAFTKVHMVGALGATINVGSPRRIEISGDDNLVPLVTTGVSEQTLTIGPTRTVRPKLDLVAKIAVPTLDALSSSGATSVEVVGLGGEKLDLSVSGAAKITARGTTGTLSIQVEGAAAINAKDLAARDVTVNVSGSGALDVTASGKLVVVVSGAGRVRYYGNPTSVAKSISGAGSVEEAR